MRLTHRRLLARAAALCAAALFASATPARASTIRDDRDPQLYLDLAARPEYASVGRMDVDLFEQGPAAEGSGTLVAPGWVLTAAHVLEGARAVQFTVGGQSYPVSRWVAHPKYDGELVRGYDLALVQLAQPVTAVTPARLYTGHKERGAVATFVGYGLTGTGTGGAVTDDRMARAGTNVIDGTAKLQRGGLKLVDKLPSTARQFTVDFDDPANPALNKLGSPYPTDLESLISRGDSGGGVFLPDPAGGLPLLAGVHSYGDYFDARDDSGYGDITGHTRVSKFAKWIDDTMDGVGGRRLQFVAPVQPFDPGVTPLRLEPGDVLAVGNVPEPGGAMILASGVLFLLCRWRINKCARSGYSQTPSH